MEYKEILNLPIDRPADRPAVGLGHKSTDVKPIFAKQEDFNSRFFLVTLTDNGVQIPYAKYGTVTKVGIGVARGDGQSKAFLGVDNGDGTFTLPLDAWAVEIPDEFILCDAMVWGAKEDGTNYLIRSASFRVYVQASGAKYTDIMDGKTYDLLSKLLQDLREFENESTEAENGRVEAEQSRVEAEDERRTAEEQRAAAEEERKASDNKRIEAEQSRVEAEEKRAEAETARVEAEQARSASETSREEAENARDEAENARIETEQERTAAEQERTAAEQERTAAEKTREQGEEAREKQESGRAEAEAARVSAEESRKTSESNRAAAEAQREKTETARVAAEQTRAAAEQGRAVAEGKRESAEVQRAADESKRAAAEEKRDEAETSRAREELVRETAEGQRDAAEEGRAEAENGRVAAEQTRVIAEGARSTAEGVRNNAEQERSAAETARAVAEGKRESVEEERVEHENARIAADKERASAETERVAAENFRSESEKLRAAEEEKRAAAELQRAAAEGARETAENEREKAEKERATAESERAIAESRRDTAETAREVAEGKRDEADEARGAAEQARDAAELGRDTAEAARVENEKLRVIAENERSTEETLRAKSEESRNGAEEQRAAAETEREKAEVKRAAAEETRSNAEADRVAAEKDRAKAETERAVAEGASATAEAARVAAEKERDAAEKARSNAEVKREAAEEARAKAETERDEEEGKRATAEAVRAESEAARGRAEEERAAAEKERAKNMPYIGANGHWFIGEKDTGVTAQGTQGVDGATWYSDFGEPEEATGKTNDFYLDTATGNVYNKTESGWGDPVCNLMQKRPTSKIYGVSGMGSVNPVWKRTYDASGVKLSLVPQGGSANLIDFVLSDPAMQDFFNFQQTTDAKGNVFVIIPPMSFRYDRIHDGEVEALSVKLYEDGDESLGYELHPAFKKWTSNSAFDGYGSVQIAKYLSSAYDTQADSEAEDDLTGRDPSEIKVRSVSDVDYTLSYVDWADGMEMIKATDPTYHMFHWMYRDLFVKLASIFFARADIYNMLGLEDGQTMEGVTGTTDEITTHSGFNKDSGQIKVFGLDAAFEATNVNGIYWNKSRDVYYTHLIDTDAATSSGYKKSSVPLPNGYGEGYYAGSITKISVDSTEKALAVPTANRKLSEAEGEDASEVKNHSEYYCSRYRDWGPPSDRGQVWAFQKYLNGEGTVFTEDGLFFSGWCNEFNDAWNGYGSYGGALRLCKIPS